MKTMMVQTGQELTGKLASLSNQALTQSEMLKLLGGDGSGSHSNPDEPPIYIKEEE